MAAHELVLLPGQGLSGLVHLHPGGDACPLAQPADGLVVARQGYVLLVLLYPRDVAQYPLAAGDYGVDGRLLADVGQRPVHYVLLRDDADVGDTHPGVGSDQELVNHLPLQFVLDFHLLQPFQFGSGEVGLDGCLLFCVQNLAEVAAEVLLVLVAGQNPLENGEVGPGRCRSHCLQYVVPELK